MLLTLMGLLLDLQGELGVLISILCTHLYLQNCHQHLWEGEKKILNFYLTKNHGARDTHTDNQPPQ